MQKRTRRHVSGKRKRVHNVKPRRFFESDWDEDDDEVETETCGTYERGADG